MGFSLRSLERKLLYRHKKTIGLHVERLPKLHKYGFRVDLRYNSLM